MGKELRKSRNSLRKNHDILQKLESKLRHKLSIIAEKFQQIAIDFDDGTDWTKLQKLGIEAVLEAVFSKFGKITDQFVKREKIWKEQSRKIKLLKNKWSKFVDVHFKNDSIECDEDDEGIKDLKNMFVLLNEKYTAMSQERDRLSDLVRVYEQKDKEQQTHIDEVEEQMLKIREMNQCLKEDAKEMEQYKNEYLVIEKRLNATNNELESTKNEYLKKSEADNEEIETLKHDYSLLSIDFGKKSEELKLVATYTRALEAKHKDLETNIDTLTLQNEILEAVKDEHAMISEQLKETEHELELQKSKNTMLMQKSQEMDELKVRHNAVNKELDDTTIKIEGLEKEFAILYKENKELKQEKDTMMQQMTTLNEKLQNMEKENTLLNERVNVSKCDASTQTDFAYILEDAHLKAVQAENAYLNKELNYLIAERSRFKECVSNDYHQGDICSMVVSPTAHNDGYQVITGGKHDNSLRIWHPLQTTGSEIEFIPKQRANIDGNVLCVNMSNDGILMAAGATLKDTVNGYVVVWNMSNDGNVLCNLRSRTFMRFGKVHTVKFMKFEDDKSNKRKKRISKKKKANKSLLNASKDKKAFNYLLFGGDTTGCILYLNIGNFQNRVADEDNKSVDYVMSRKLFKDDSKYALKSIVYNKKSNELVFGSRKCNLFQLNADNDENDDDDEKGEKRLEAKCGLNTKDLDHISNLRIRNNLIAVQRNGINYVKIFDVNLNKFIKNYQIDDGNDDHKFKIYDCGISHDRKYAILCVGIFNKENLSNLNLSRSALKGFKIPKAKK